MLGMTVDEALAYDLALRFTKAMRQVVEVEPLYLDDNMYYIDELVYKVAGLDPFAGIRSN